MIAPTIGRVVWYFPSDDEVKAHGMLQHDPKVPFDAHIVYVWSDTCVNLIVFDHEGSPWRRTSIAINVEGAQPHAEWMPYQIGQAKKNEETK